MVFVNYIYDVVADTQFHKFYGRPFARVLYLFLMKDVCTPGTKTGGSLVLLSLQM